MSLMISSNSLELTNWWKIDTNAVKNEPIHIVIENITSQVDYCPQSTRIRAEIVSKNNLS